MQKCFKLNVPSTFRLLRISKISYKLGFILVGSIIIPMIIFAYLSLSISLKSDFHAVSKGNLKVAMRAAEQMDQYISNSIRILQSVSENINGLHLTKTQKDIAIKNHVLTFEEFDKIIVTDRNGREIVTSKMGQKLEDFSKDVAFAVASQKRVYFSDISISDNFVPSMIIAIPSLLHEEFNGAVIAKINLINMWRLVDSLTIGKQGYALVVSKTGVVVAHGEGNSKREIVREKNLFHLKIVKEVLFGKSSISEYQNANGIKVLGAAAPVKTVNWGLIVEQPLSEAYAPTYKMGKRLLVLGLIILLVMSFVAYVGVNNSVVKPLKKLVGGIKGKDLSFDSGDEFQNLANFYNFMSKSVTELEATLEKYSKLAKLGKMSAGFIHDLKHPIDNVVRITKHLVKHIKDDELKKFSRELLEHESKNLDHLISKIKEPLLASSPVLSKNCVNQMLNDLCWLFQKKLDEHKIRVIKNLCNSNTIIYGNRFDQERVIKNIMLNAVEAMSGGGYLTLSSKRENSHTIISISDTGHGIEPQKMKTLFTESGSQKKEGWGIGLSVSKELMNEMDGALEVESVLGKGTTFTLRFHSH